MGTHERLAALLRAHHGVITRAQALEVGLSDHRIRGLVRRGEWETVGRGLYRTILFRLDWRASMLIACRRTGGVASHRAAAHLHGMEGFRQTVRDVTVSHGRHQRIAGVTIHQTTQLDRADPTEIDGIPCTGLARTVLDASHLVSFRRIEDAVDGLLRERRIDWEDLYGVLARHARRGRNGSASLRRFLDARGGDERIPLSSWSRMVVELLVANGLPEPRIEYRVTSRDGRLIAQVDLAYPSSRIAIELDSVRFHLNRTSFEEDRRRWNRLVAEGWTVLAFTWADYADRPLELVDRVRAALGSP